VRDSGTPENIGVANGNGYSGSPQVALLEEIASNHISSAT
jgi:hypothetical protein